MLSKRSLTEADKKQVAYNQKWHCNICENILPSTFETDHIIPFCITYNDHVSNLQALCPNCHRQKTRHESKRINEFKKLTAIKDKTLCWFCLEKCSDDHYCDKTLKKINIIQKNTLPSHCLDKYIFTNETPCEQNKTLHIKLTPEVIWVNNYFTDMKGQEETYNVERITRAVYIATKNLAIKFNQVEVVIDFTEYTDEEIPDDMIEHFDEFFEDDLKNIGIIDSDKTDFTYICID